MAPLIFANTLQVFVLQMLNDFSILELNNVKSTTYGLGPILIGCLSTGAKEMMGGTEHSGICLSIQKLVRYLRTYVENF